MTDEQDELIEQAQLGIETEVFFRSKVGKYLLWRADEERAELITRLIAASPSDEKENSLIRQQLSAIDMCLQWTSDAVSSGHLAENQIHQEDAEQD